MQSLKVLSQEAIHLLEKNQILSALIIRELTKTCLSEIELNEQDRNIAKQLIINKEKITSEENYKEWLVKQFFSEEELLTIFSEPPRIDRYVIQKYKHMAESRFLKRKEQLDTVTYSLVRVKDNFLANELYLRLAEGESDFGEISKEFSLGPEKKTRGILGPTPVSQAHPALVNCLKNSKPGEINKPLNIEELWLVTRVESRTEASLTSEMELQMSKEIFYEWLQEESKKEHNKLLNMQTSLNKL